MDDSCTIYKPYSIDIDENQKSQHEKLHSSFNQQTNAFEMSFSDPYYGVRSLIIESSIVQQ